MSGNTMAIVPAEAPESSSHTGKGALVAHPPADSVAPAWFTGFMQMTQLTTQTMDDKLSSMVSNQQRTLDVVQELTVTALLIHRHYASSLCWGAC